MRHLLGRVAFSVCALALFLQPASAASVPHHKHSSASARARTSSRTASRRNPARHGHGTTVRLAGIPVPLARPGQLGDAPRAIDLAVQLRPSLDADDTTADDQDAAATDQTAALPLDQNQPPPDLSGDDAPRIEVADRSYNCVAYIRERTGFVVQGDAHLWWDHAEGLYDRAGTPEPDAVMVFAATRSMKRGHVALVTKVVSDREIIVDHANWMRDGKLYLNMPVMDVSPNNDWTLVRVWNARDHQWGARAYPIRGFVSARQPLAS
ncbi:MAG TPA: CHAP domain-containing protein [Rhizomicrobium sp.]